MTSTDDPDHFDDKGRLLVNVADRNPVDVADQVVTYLVASNDPPHLFSMGSSAVLLSEDGSKLIPLDIDGWLTCVSRRITFTAPNSQGKPRIVVPPAAVMKMVSFSIVRVLPPLDGIATTPYLDKDGNVITANGYNPASRLVLYVDGKIPDIPKVPTKQQVACAVRLLKDEWLTDFPFENEASIANTIGMLLTLTGRMLFSLAPLHIVDASTSGSGKGLLITTISLITTGEYPHTMELPPNADEQRKVITSALMAGRELIMWDEAHTITGKSLASILTAEIYSDRLLGSNKMITVRNRFTQVAAGNNVTVYGDTKRRVVPIRLVPDTEHPEARSKFRHDDLPEWVHQNRWELLAAALTIWRNWIARGRRDSAYGMGSFERWARAVGGALRDAGITDFRANTAAWLSHSDDDDSWAGHLAQLYDRCGERWFTADEIAAAIQAGHLKEPPIKRDPGQTLDKQLGYAWRKIRDAQHGDLRIVRSEGRNSAKGGYTWSVRPVKTAETSPVSPGSPAADANTQVIPVNPADSTHWRSQFPESSSPGSPVEAPVPPRTGDDTPSPVISSNRSGPVTPGQSVSTGDTGDTGDENPDLQTNGWPGGTIGASAGVRVEVSSRRPGRDAPRRGSGAGGISSGAPR
jgi:hypothetical protein